MLVRREGLMERIDPFGRELEITNSKRVELVDIIIDNSYKRDGMQYRLCTPRISQTASIYFREV